MQGETRIVFKDKLGAMRDPEHDACFVATVERGERGIYQGEHPNVPGWHIVSVVIDDETLYVPVVLDLHAKAA